MPDKLAYRIIVSDSKGTLQSEIQKYFSSADITHRTEAVSSAVFTFFDRDRKLEKMLVPTATYYIKFEASNDGGISYSQFFDGLVETIDIELQPSGQRTIKLSAYGSPGLRYSYVSPNQIAIGEYDMMKTVFIGTPTASDGTPWKTDSRGNWPNGLLYDTGYSYSSKSVADYYTGTLDIPIRIGASTRKKLEAIKNFLNPFGATFYIDDITKEVIVLKHPLLQDFSPAPVATFSVGRDINTYNRSLELHTVRNVVTVIGESPKSWAQVGFGAFEDVLRDTDVLDCSTAYDNARVLWSISQEPEESGMVTTYPVKQSLIGKSIILREIDGTIITRSVIGVNNSFQADRWITKLTFEVPRITSVNTLAEIMQSLSSERQEDIRSDMYIRASAGSNSYYAPLTATLKNIVAIGIGTGTKTNAALADSSALDKPLLYKLITDYKDTGGTFTRGEQRPKSPKAWTIFQAEEGNGLIREIGIFANNLTAGAVYRFTKSFTWNRPTTEWSGSGYTLLGYLDQGRFPLNVVDVFFASTAGNSATVYPYSAKTARVFYIPTGSVVLTATKDKIPIPSESSIWFDLDSSTEVISSEKIKASRDLIMSTPSFYAFTATGKADLSVPYSPNTIFKYRVPWTGNKINNPALADRLLKDIRLMALYRGWNSNSINGLTAVTCSAAVYNWTVNDWVTLGWNVSSLASMTFKIDSLKTIFPSSKLSDFIDTDGYITFLLYDQPKIDGGVTRSGQYGIVVGYQACVFETKDIAQSNKGLTTVFEFVPISMPEGRFMFSFQPKQIIGMWASASATEFGYIPLGPDLSTWLPDVIPSLKDNYLDVIDEDVLKVKVRHAPRRGGRGVEPSEFRYVKHDLFSSEKTFRRASLIDDIDAMRTIVNNGGAWFGYETRATYEMESIPRPAENLISWTLNQADNGKTAIVSISMYEAPPYGIQINVVYDCIGSSSANSGGCIGRVLITDSGSMSFSSVREGIDKNKLKEMNVQFEWSASTGSGWVIGGYAGIYRTEFLTY